MMKQVDFIIVDLFSGAGGVSTGFEMAEGFKVIAAINHDEMAIQSHLANHPEAEHFIEDIRSIQMEKLQVIVESAKNDFPNALLILWASLECTNFSKAKGGLPRDGDSRSLADFMPWYIQSLKPDYIGIENVIEFMSWGPLDEKGKPISKKEGCDYMRWVDHVKKLNLGYSYDWKELNAADFGAYTSRKRFFAWFAHNGLPIKWPQATHSKVSSKKELSLFDRLEPWRAVKEVLDLQIKGKSIFERNKTLSEKTLERIYAGLLKFVAGGKENHSAFITKYYSGRPEGKVIGVDGPVGTITTAGNQNLVQTEFLASYYGSGDNVGSIENPSGTLTTKDRVSIVQPQFIYRDFGSETNSSIDSPAGSITGSPKLNLVSCEPFVMDTNFGNSPANINEPSRTITANRKWHYLVNPQWFNKSGGSIENPCATLIARMDKAPMYLVEVEGGKLAIAVFESDSEMTVKIKEFMAMYGIIDIKMRMLSIEELKRIQGFPDGYILMGNQTQQKKYIGNSVVPVVVKKMAEALKSATFNKVKVA